MIDDPTTPRPARPVGRRTALLVGLAAGGAGALAACGARAPAPPAPTPPAATPPPTDPAAFAERMAGIEARLGGRVGVAAVDVGTRATLGHRAGERFLSCSTIKVAVAAAVLARSVTEPGLLERRLRWSRADLLSYAPVTTRALGTGLTVAQLCDAAITVSDNTAVNLLSAQIGGPAAVTEFLRGIGDATTRADRPETALNDLAGDLDTTTPTAYVATLEALTLGTALPEALRARLVGWMRACTTGAAQIRAGTPAGWVVADKTGSGSAGEANDVGLIWPPGRAPVVLTVYTAPADRASTAGKAAIAATTAEVLRGLGLPGR